MLTRGCYSPFFCKSVSWAFNGTFYEIPKNAKISDKASPIINNWQLLVYLTIPDKSNLGQYMTFGETIKKQRESKGLLLRQVAAFLEVDTAFVSKLERNERNASREQVIKLAEFLETLPDQLLTIWLAEKIIGTINNDRQGEAALKLALKNWKNK